MGPIYYPHHAPPPVSVLFRTVVLVVVSVFCCCCVVRGDNLLPLDGEVISDHRVFPLSQSPFKFNNDLVITKSGRLTISPGVELRFAPRRGIVVQGALIAKGLPAKKIVFTRLDGGGIRKNNFAQDVNHQLISSSVQWPEGRLVDGDLPSEGRLQLKINDRWHSVCTNSKNWTKVDIDVLCKQLGFVDGDWYTWFNKYNDSRQVMLEAPSCSGSERQIQECPQWPNRRVGSGICDYHTDIGIRCSKHLLHNDGPSTFWSGLRFVDALTRDTYIRSLDSKMKRKQSESILEHVEIYYAGENARGEATAAIEATGVPPTITGSLVRWSASSAINITNPGDGFRIENTRLYENRGYGIFINSSDGQVQLEGLEVANNGADGIRYTVREDLAVGEQQDFCHFANLADNQVYPVRLTHQQNRLSQSKNKCCQEFRISNYYNRDAQLTVHFPHMSVGEFEGEEKDRHRVADGTIEVLDGYRKALVAKFVVRNDTMPSSVTSNQGRLQICYYPAILKRVLFTAVVVADTGRAYELNVTKSQIKENNGRGIWIQGQVTGTVLNYTLVSNHSYIAGVHMSVASGDIIVNNSRIMDNIGDGLNVSSSAGNRHVDRSVIVNNSGRGIAFWFNETTPSSIDPTHSVPFVSQVTYSNIMENGGNGLLISNVCRSDSFSNISMNVFQGNEDDAFVFHSCWPRRKNEQNDQPSNITQLVVSNNQFIDNRRLAIRAAPMANVKASVVHNTFKLQRTGTFYINSQDELGEMFKFEDSPAEVNITDNMFSENSGRFVVNIGLQENSDQQRINFMRNVLERNVISEPFANLNPRSRVAAVLCVSSSNVQIIRNNLVNMNSRYEIGSHVEGHSKVINGSFNFFGRKLTAEQNTADIYSKIFDRKNRYNLAQVEFLPYRTVRREFNSNDLLSVDRERDKFIPFIKGQKLGGEVRGDFVLEPGVFQVTEDIFVRPGAKLVIAPDSTLNFDQSIGLMVQGKLEAVGRSYQQIRFTGSGSITNPAPVVPNVLPPSRPVMSNPVSPNRVMKAPPLMTTNLKKNISDFGPTVYLGKETASKKDNSTLPNNETVPSLTREISSNKNRTRRSTFEGANVRLSNRYEGKLEVLVNGQWGGVCSYGFDIVDAAIACQQIGLTLNSRDWLLEQSQYSISQAVNTAISNLKCSVVDTDITTCVSEKASSGDFTPNACPQEVGIRCHAPSWSGLRLGIVADESILENVVIEKAGLLDYGTKMFKPALQVDFMRHRLKNLTVTGNGDSGVGFVWNDLFLDKDLLTLRGSHVTNNVHHGLISRSQGLRIIESDVSGNRGSGFHYEPMVDAIEQRDLMSWVAPNDADALIMYPSQSDLYESGRKLYLDPGRRSYWYLKIDEKPPVALERWFTVETVVGHSIGVLVLNPVQNDATDNLTISNIANSLSWDLKANLSSFPMLTYAYRLNFTYSSGPRPQGGLVLYLSVKRLSNDIYSRRDTLLDQERAENLKIKTIELEGNVFRLNGRGISANHYSRDVGHFDYDAGAIYHRHGNETIRLTNNLIESSKRESILISAPFYEPRDAALAEINYTLNGNQITKNGRGIGQFSRDIRNSNNLFHWHLKRNVIEDNHGSGILIRLPYVWQYNENFTHSIVLEDNTFVRNHEFMVLLDGHYAEVNMTGNLFSENHCREGLLRISGMEKKLRIEENIFKDNFGHFVVEFAVQSHADKFGLVQAEFRRNHVLRNRDTLTTKAADMYHPQSYAIALRGVQFVNVTRNLLNNPNLQFELLAGVLTGSLDNTLNVEENWWGHFDSKKISARIFDFDDWNSYAVADFSPFLGAQEFDAVTVPVDIHEDLAFIDLEQPLGGRVHRNLVLKSRPRPYVVKSDLTIMPDATLTIDADVVIEFYPSVGLLVLGEMTIAGYDGRPVVMRPVSLQGPETRFKREVANVQTDYESGLDGRRTSTASDLSDIRLCVSESCKEWIEVADGQSKPSDGFLEVYNRTTLQWMAVCDERFSERNAQVTCRQLGHSSLNVQLRRGHRYDVGPTLISRVRFWPEPLECQGTEPSLGDCDVRLNGFGNHSHACKYDGDSFVYVHCGKEPESVYHATSSGAEGTHYWGGVRFARSRFESGSNGRRTSNYRPPSRTYSSTLSRVQHLNIIGAGILHGEKNAALQLVQRDINLEFVNISGCAYHGIESIAPSGHLVFHRLEVRDNLGAGLNYLLLGGASTEVATIPYIPLELSTIPYNLYGLVDICDTNKRLVVEERVLLYYKYDNRPVDCVKIFAAGHSAKRLGLRILQFNLFNSTNYAAFSDSVQLFNGDIFNQTTKLIGDLGVTEGHRIRKPELMFYSSTEATLSVRLHASGAASTYGFIAEVVTLPVSYYVGRGFFHNVTFSELSGNVLGALNYKSACETAPSVALDYNRFEYNCRELFGNFTSCDAALDFELQNSPQFFFRNNLVRGNQGGLKLEVNAQSAAAALYGLLVNNLFEQNKNKEVLYVQGPQSGSYQVVEVISNYFTNNVAAYKSTIVLDKVVANFTENVVVANTGRHQMSVLGFERVPISYQTIRGNWFYNNMAVGSGHFGIGLNGDERSTIFASNAGQRYVENYLVNPENDFELATMNRSALFADNKAHSHQQTAIAYWKSSIDARENWWGFNESSAIASRVLEQTDYIDLVRVDYTPFHSSNATVLSGICAGGWTALGHTCFLYVGARMTFEEAQKFCERQNSTMPVVRTNRRELTEFLYEQQDRYDHRFFRVWVQSFDFDIRECTVLVDNSIYRNEGGCQERLPFFCEKDPDIRVIIGTWYREPLGIAALAVSTITALLTFCCVCCWLCKSREKAKEKLQRRNSIRASIRSNRSVMLSSTAGSLDGIGYRKNYDKILMVPRGGQTTSGSTSTQMDNTPLNANSPVKYQRGHGNGNGSLDSSLDTKRQFMVADGDSSVSYDPAVRGQSAYRPLEDRFVEDPGLENANVQMMVRPTFDLTFHNEGFQGTPTPTASRASNIEYSEARDWTPQATPTVSTPSKRLQALPRTPSPSYGEFPRQTPSPTSTGHFNTYESAATYETLPRRDLTFSTFGGVQVLPMSPPHRPQPPPRVMTQMLTTSQNSLLQGAGGSDITAATHLTTATNRTDNSNRRFMETSLDGDSVQENNYDYCDYRFRMERPSNGMSEQGRSSPSMSILTASSKETSKSKPTLETAM